MERDKKDNSRKRKLQHFLDRQGFYVVLFVCICVIGVTALFTTRDRNKLDENKDLDDMAEYDSQQSTLDDDMYMKGLYSGLHLDSDEPKDEEDKKDTEDQEDVEDPAGKEASTGENIDIKVEDVLTDEKAKDESKEAKEDKEGESKEDEPKEKEPKKDSNAGDTQKQPSEPAAKPVDNPTEEKPSSTKGSKVIMTKPVQGNTIICDYAKDELVYSNTLKEWRTHPGIDIECPLGSEVRAVLDGTVKSIDEDSLMGITITLDHGGGILTKYANLSTKEMVKVDEKVKSGQVISGVGRTAAAEILDAPHLHFEVFVDGQNVDPNKFFE